jgi:hypothetical protein
MEASVVKRFTAEESHGGVIFEPDDAGDLVHFSAYQALQAALREALNIAEVASDNWRNLYGNPIINAERVAAIRAQFLDDK